MPRKLSAIRQLSLQCDSPTSTRRASLKKQQSEESKDDVGIRISLSAKSMRSGTPNPPTVKIAWDDPPAHNQPNPSARRHSTEEYLGGASSGRSQSLYARKDLAQKLHLAWQDKENTKNKLNIFLVHDYQENNRNAEYQEVSPRVEPKIIQPMLQLDENATNLKQIFQKQLRKSKLGNSPRSESDMMAVVVPIIEKPSTSVTSEARLRRDKSLSRVNSEVSVPVQEEDVKVRPQTSTASQKRAMFQKRTNSAFHSLATTPNSNSTCASPLPGAGHSQSRYCPRPRPPMIRSSSLPTKPDIQVKPRLRRKIKVTKRGKPTTMEQDHEKKSTDVVTLVSLVSASESEADEPEVKPLSGEVQKVGSPKKIGGQHGEKHFSLRKTVKQVSFQHSSIHAVRSFSASFPARRASVGTSVLLDGAARKLQKSLEKRGQPVGGEGLAEAKRRLLQPNVNRDGGDTILQEKPLLINKSTAEIPNSTNPENPENQENSPMTTNAKQDGGDTAKERKCWETYCRMTKSGLNVSFDTILRGMLTPTEYRLQRRLSLARADEVSMSEACTNEASMASNTSNVISH